MLKHPVILTTQRLVPEFLGAKGLNAQTIENIRHLKPGLYSNLDSSPFPGFTKHPETTAVLMLTSGSSGNAKTFCLRHGLLLRSVKGKSKHHETTKSDTFFNWIGLGHVANLAESHLHAILVQSRYAFMPRICCSILDDFRPFLLNIRSHIPLL